MNNQLPNPDQESLQHSSKVGAHIRGEISAAQGSIAFSEFMQHALYAPDLGYYVSGLAKFGAAGDFVTAPEISPIFSRVLAVQVADALRQFNAVAERNILEVGAGTGSLAVNVLRKLQELGQLPTNYYILDVSDDLRDRQSEAIQDALPSFFERVVWLDGLPERFDGVVIANEVLDALPVERFTKQVGSVMQRRVACENDELCWQIAVAPTYLSAAVVSLENALGVAFNDGYTSEVAFSQRAWISDIAKSLNQGLIFIFDYGVSQREYYAIDRQDGWLRCHFRHYAHSDPLRLPGIQDLTAWVDFTAVANSASKAGLRVISYCTQAQFLLQCGLQDEISDMTSLPTSAQIEMARQVKVLTLPGEMGENVKCLVLGKGPITVSERVTDIDRSHAL